MGDLKSKFREFAPLDGGWRFWLGMAAVSFCIVVLSVAFAFAAAPA